jgi:hypothetical protein
MLGGLGAKAGHMYANPYEVTPVGKVNDALEPESVSV